MIDPRRIVQLGPHFWQKLCFFYEVVRLRKYATASAYLKLSPSSLTRAVQDLETRLQHPLLKRNNQDIHLTPQGHLVFEYAESLMKGVQQLERLLADPLYHSKQMVLQMDQALTDIVIKPLIAFKQAYPQSVPRIGSVVKADQEAGVVLEIRLGSRPPLGGHYQALTALKLGFYASSAYLSAQGRPVHVEDLIKHQWIDYGDQEGGVFSIAKTVTLLGLSVDQWPKPFLTVDSPSTLIQMVEAGLGIMIWFKNDPMIKKNNFIEILSEDPRCSGLSTELYVGGALNVWAIPEVKALCAQLEQHFKRVNKDLKG